MLKSNEKKRARGTLEANLTGTKCIYMLNIFEYLIRKKKKRTKSTVVKKDYTMNGRRIL